MSVGPQNPVTFRIRRHERSGGSDRNRGKASSYINPDSGSTATANPDVNADSSCFKPDQYDKQAFTKNVHNDACFLDDSGKKVNGPASFQSKGSASFLPVPTRMAPGPRWLC